MIRTEKRGWKRSLDVLRNQGVTLRTPAGAFWSATGILRQLRYDGLESDRSGAQSSPRYRLMIAAFLGECIASHSGAGLIGKDYQSQCDWMTSHGTGSSLMKFWFE